MVVSVWSRRVETGENAIRHINAILNFTETEVWNRLEDVEPRWQPRTSLLSIYLVILRLQFCFSVGAEVSCVSRVLEWNSWLIVDCWKLHHEPTANSETSLQRECKEERQLKNNALSSRHTWELLANKVNLIFFWDLRYATPETQWVMLMPPILFVNLL